MLPSSPPGIRLQSYLGSGPSGHVYRARDEVRGRDVAVKLLDSSRCTPAGLVRLAAGVARASASSNTRSGQLYAVVPDPVQPFIVMDLQPGESLQRVLLRQGPMEWKQARAFAHAITTILVSAHELGVVHGALKPTNVFLHDGLVHLTDYGIRSLADPCDPNALLDAADYLAPEQLRGEPADERSDVYGVGLLLFELVTGQLPFFGSPREILKQKLWNRPPAPTSFVPTLPPAADHLLLRLLDRDPGRRPASASHLQELLRLPEPEPARSQCLAASSPRRSCRPAVEISDSGVTSRKASNPPELPRPDPRARAPAGTLAVAALATALAGSLATTCL